MHGCSPLTLTNRKLTAHDIVTAYSIVPGREGVASLLEEAMREEGWQSSRMIQQRYDQDAKAKQVEAEKAMRETIDAVLELDGQWWRNATEESPFSELSDDDSDGDEGIYACWLYIASISI